MTFSLTKLWALLIAGFTMVCGFTAARAAIPNAATRVSIPEGKRWLLIVETSSAMQRLKPGALDSIREMLEGQMSGQLKPQDTIGVWTFDRELHMGELPLQRWPASGKNDVTTRILEFIGNQPFDQPPNLKSVMEPLLGLATRSELLTVVLVSSGNGSISGTPFDRAIDEAWFAWGQSRSKRPVITVLRIQNGKFIQQSVTPADFEAEMPPFPSIAAPKEKPVETVPATNIARPKTNAPPVVRKATPNTNAPVGALIFSGPNKREPETPAPIARTNSPVASTDAVPVAAPLPANVVATQTLSTAAPPVPQPPIITNPPALVLTQTLTQPKTNLVRSPGSSLPTNETAKTTPKPAPAPEPTPKPPSKQTNVSTVISATQPANPPIASAPSSQKPPETNQAATLPPTAQPASTGRLTLYIAAGASAFILVAGALVLWTRRKSRSHVSLITESVEKDRKDRSN